MATLIDSVGTQHYANKMVLAENRKVGSKSLPSALADVDNLIDEMKELFEGEYGSALDMKLENNENVFSVGTGSGIDRRSEVENGFTDIEIKGESLVNLVNHNELQVGSNMVVSNGEYNFPIIATDNTNDYYAKANVLDFENKGIIKPQTNYTVIVDVKNCSTSNALVFGFVGERFSGWQSNFLISKNGRIVFLINSGENPWGTRIRNNSFDGGTSKKSIKNLMILEGDYTNKPLPQYFEGLKSVGEKEDRNEIEVLSVGKNLFDNANVERGNISSGVNPGSDLISYSFMRSGSFIPVKPNTVYSIKLHTQTNNVVLEKIMEYKAKIKDESGWNKSNQINNTQFMLTTDANTKYVRLTFRNRVDSNIIVTNEDLINSKIDFKEYVYSDEYLPFKQDKKQISLNEPLRGLPNGTRDSIEKINGEWKLVRRCGEVVLDETKNFTLSSQSENTIYCILQGLTAKNNGYCISDRFYYELGSNDNEHIRVNANGQIVFWINHSKLTVVDLVGVREWLSQNPTKVVYELATPIIEDIDEVTLQSWKNGTISIDEVLPVETTHTVALNKPAQIKRNIEELTELRNKVQALENQYDQIALEQAHKLELLNHSFELDYNI